MTDTTKAGPAKDRSKAYSAAEKRLRDANAPQFQRFLREELAKYGLEPVADKRKAKAEADLAKIRAEFPELLEQAEAATSLPDADEPAIHGGGRP